MNDKTAIFFQLFNPVLYVCSGIPVSALVGNTGDSAQESRAHFGYQFLFAVKVVTEAVAESAIKAALVPRAVY